MLSLIHALASRVFNSSFLQGDISVNAFDPGLCYSSVYNFSRKYRHRTFQEVE